VKGAETESRIGRDYSYPMAYRRMASEASERGMKASVNGHMIMTRMTRIRL
jgi:hypothetical protein